MKTIYIFFILLSFLYFNVVKIIVLNPLIHHIKGFNFMQKIMYSVRFYFFFYCYTNKIKNFYALQENNLFS